MAALPKSAPADTPAAPVASDEALFRALTSRKNPAELKLTDAERSTLVEHVIREFEDADSGSRQFKSNMADMLANWRGVADEKDFPFEGCANVRVPLTSVYIEQMKARILKAALGGELWAKLQYLEKQVELDKLNEANAWWNYELREVVKLKDAVRDIIHDMLVTGISTPIPYYDRETKYLHSFKEWLFDDSQPLQAMILQGLQEILEEPSSWGVPLKYEVKKQSAPGVFELAAVEKDRAADGGRIVFSLNVEKMKLRADIWKREITFDGAKVNYVSLEDLVVANTARSIDDLPFFGVRLFYSVNEYRQGLQDGFFIDYGEEENNRIIAGSDIKQGDFIGQQFTDLQDSEEGTDSRDSSSDAVTHRFIECYRWEGWWTWSDNTDDAESMDRVLAPATQICAWVEPRSKALLKIARLEDLNKDGKRSGVKFGFIEEPGRFYPMGLAEWVRHSQNIIDAINNQRLDAGLLFNVPWGLYKPTAGLRATIKIEPGMLYPSAEPQALNMPRTNWQQTYSMQEEMLQRRYADMQAGLSEQAVGNPPTKRQSATEVVSTAAALDQRTEDILERFLEALKELLTRLLGLYQQFGSEERIFRVGGEGGVQMTKRFERDRLQGRMVLTMCGNLDQINEQLQRQLATDMFQMLLSEILMQTGVVQPDTIYQAVKLIAKLYHYDDVPLHKPQTQPISDAPEVEEQQMFMGQKPLGPTMTENTGEHLQHHMMTMADKNIQWTPQSMMLFQQHVQATMQMADAIKLMNQQRAALAAQAAVSMQQQKVNGDRQQPNQNTGPGTQAEGVGGANMSPSAPTPGAQ